MRLRRLEVLRSGRAEVTRVVDEDSGARAIEKRFLPEHRDHFVRERAALRALAPLSEGYGLVPRLLHHDDATLGLLLAEVTGPTLEHVLAEGDALAATDALVATAERLGRLHGAARELTVAAPSPPSPGTALARGAAATLAFCRRALGGELDAEELATSLAGLAERVDRPSPLSTVTVGDMAPSNVLLGPSGPVFVDLEYCARRHAAYDAVFFRVICCFPRALGARIDASYQAGLGSEGVELDPEGLSSELLAFAAQRLFWTLSWGLESLFDADREFAPGVSARAQVRRYLAEFLALAAQAPPGDPVLPRVVRGLESRLGALWPEANPDLEFPCFARVTR